MGAERMLKPFAVALLAIVMSVGFAQAKGPKHVNQTTKHVHQTKRVHRHKLTATKHVRKNETPQKKAIPMCAEGNISCIYNPWLCCSSAEGRGDD